MHEATSRRMPSPLAAWAIFLLAGIALVGALRLENDNRFDRMLEPGTPAALEYEEFLRQFGNDEFIVVAISGKPIFDSAGLDAMTEALERLEEVPHVAHVSGVPVVFRDQFGGEDIEALEEELTSTPFYRGLFLSDDGEVSGILVETEIMDTPGSREALVDGIREAVRPLAEHGYRVDLVGEPVFSTDLNALSMRESMRTFPFAAAASLVMLMLLLRSLRASAMVLICGGLSLLLTLGAIGWSGYPLNVVTAALPLILWVLALANCIHLVMRFQHYRGIGEELRPALEAALGEVRFPCCLSAVTTAMGFLSLTTADVPPVRELGLWMALGMIFSLAVNLLAGPHLLLWLRAPAPRWGRKTFGISFQRLGERVVQRPRLILGIVAVFVLTAVAGMLRVESQADTLGFLPEDAQVVSSYHFVAERLTGTSSLEVIIEFPDSWLNPAHWPAVEALAADLAGRDSVARVISALDTVKKINQWDHDIDPAFYVLPDSREEAERLVELMGDAEREGLRRLVTDDGLRMRVSVLTHATNSRKFNALVEHARAAAAALPAPMRGSVTGMVVRLEDMQQSLVASQIRSFGVAFLLVFGTILIGMRSLRITVVSIFPNAIPVMALFAVMGFAAIPLDAATVMVASIALGIAVDDTLHLLAGYNRERLEGQNAHAAITRTLAAVGPSITVTTATACIGFFTLATSSFVPIHYLGLLSGIAMLVALASDLIMAPAMLALRDAARHRKGLAP